MRSVVFIALPALALVACSSPEDVAEATGVEDKATLAAGTPPQPPAPAGDTVSVKDENDLYSFDFSYPGAVAEIPALKSQFEKKRDASKAALVKEAREAQTDAKEMGFPYNAYAEGTQWKVVTDTPRFLSLSADIYSYTGGAHPNSTSDSLVWDKNAARSLKSIDLFTSGEALRRSLSADYCEQLDQLRAKRRGAPVDGGDGLFSECPNLDELVILLGSSTGEQFNRIGLIAPPYVAGSYAEGAYEVTLPVTAAVLETVKPAYRDAFSVK
ncbi:DUF4163 domain-containing protein [Parerythrobacter jejuensis]|nr:DUF4163 domain-containing protein [Parerythrobacter jejuensis]